MASRQIRPIRVEGNVAYVPLTQGYEAVIDAADLALVERANWHASVDRRADGSVRCVYAATRRGRRGQQELIFMHRAILDADCGLEVDHRDCDGINNRRENLRLATREENARNQRRNKCAVAKGATYIASKAKWQAQIKVARRSIFLGLFMTEAEAHAAYAMASAKFHGEYGRLE